MKERIMILEKAVATFRNNALYFAAIFTICFFVGLFATLPTEKAEIVMRICQGGSMVIIIISLLLAGGAATLREALSKIVKSYKEEL